jgi:hypothetical protein
VIITAAVLVVGGLAGVGYVVMAPESEPTPAAGGEDSMPTAGTCYRAADWAATEVNAYAEGDEAVACEEEHDFETVAAERRAGRRPEAGSNALRAIHQRCAEVADAYLGVSWRTTHTWLVVSLPSPHAWLAGAQWFRCDLVANMGVYPFGNTMVTTTGRLAETARPITCLTWRIGPRFIATLIKMSDCDEPHQAEFVGILAAPVGSEAMDGQRCMAMAVEYLGRTRPHPELAAHVLYANPPLLAQGVPCLIAAAHPARAFVGSLADIGDDPIEFLS